MKKAMIIIAAIMMLFLAVGCSSLHKMEQPKSFAESLYAAKNPYVGNNSADADIVSLLRLGNFGKYTLTVENDEHPYTLAIRYMYVNSSVNPEEFQGTMTYSSILILSLIENCEQVTWSYPSPEGQQTGAVGLDYANELMGLDVKKAAKDEVAFTELCNKLFPDRAA